MEKISLALYNNRRKIMVVSFLIIGIVALLFYWNYGKEDDVIIEENNKIEEKEEEPIYIYVDIKGRVKNEGVYKIIEGARIVDAIKVAGGLLDDADTSLINMSMKVKDEMQIVIFSKSQVEDFVNTKNDFNKKISECEKQNDICMDKIVSDDEQEVLNINKASINDFMSLPGIGEAKAQSIIDYRNSHGPFNTLDEIKEVSGIGDSLYEKIKGYITI